LRIVCSHGNSLRCGRLVNQQYMEMGANGRLCSGDKIAWRHGNRLRKTYG
jgi:hypothetical protein